jgi:two-component system, OmpR family, alkaline phosphatase synthesis response regulator PhoP
MPKRKILIIDDIPQIVQLLKFYVQKAGYDGVVATNGWEGLQQATAEQPDVILVDAMMPEMDGFEFIERFRKLSRINSAKIIMVTTLSGDEFRTRALNVGADDFITKPVSEEILHNKIESLFISS